MRTVLVLRQNDLIWKFMKGPHGFMLNCSFLNFLDVYEKNPCKKNKVSKNRFDEQEKSWTYLKIFRKKHKNFRAILAVLDHLKTKIFSVGQIWWPIFFGDLVPPTILVLLRCCLGRNKIHFLVTTSAHFTT